MKLVNKIKITILTIVFIVSFFLLETNSYGIVENELEFLTFGIIILVINVLMFCMILKELNKHYDDKNKYDIKTYIYIWYS